MENNNIQTSITTIMLRNMPKNISTDDLLKILTLQNYSVDFIYVCVDCPTKICTGSAFVNFNNAYMALKFINEWNKKKSIDLLKIKNLHENTNIFFDEIDNNKYLNIVFAKKQGFENCIKKTANKHIKDPILLPYISPDKKYQINKIINNNIQTTHQIHPTPLLSPGLISSPRSTEFELNNYSKETLNFPYKMSNLLQISDSPTNHKYNLSPPPGLSSNYNSSQQFNSSLNFKPNQIYDLLFPLGTPINSTEYANLIKIINNQSPKLKHTIKKLKKQLTCVQQPSINIWQ
jgi:hypothetical protein